MAYHGGALCIDHVGPDAPELASIRRRFAVFDDLLARTLRALGVAAAVGEVPGEYCPGEFSVNDGRGHKLVGTAQRLVPRTWLFSAVILISHPDPLRAVLEAVYADWNWTGIPATVGAVDRSVPGLTWNHVHTALLAAYAARGELVPAVMPDSAIALARSRADRHRVPQS